MIASPDDVEQYSAAVGLVIAAALEEGKVVYGAQGTAAADTAPAFRDDGLGAAVNSSRDVLFPYPPADPAWEAAVERATRATIASLAAATPMGKLASPPAGR